MNKFKKVLLTVFFIIILFVTLLTPVLGVNGGYTMIPIREQNWTKTPDDIDWSIAPAGLRQVLDCDYWAFSSRYNETTPGHPQTNTEMPIILVNVTSDSNAIIYFGYNCSFGSFLDQYNFNNANESGVDYNYLGIGFVSSRENFLVSSLSSIRYNFETNEFHTYIMDALNSPHYFIDENGLSRGPVWTNRIYTNSSTQMNYKRDFYLYGSNVSGETDFRFHDENFPENGYVSSHDTVYNFSGNVDNNHTYIVSYYFNLYGIPRQAYALADNAADNNYYFSTFVPKIKGDFDEVLNPNNYSTTPPTTNPAVSEYSDIESELNQYGDYGFDSLDSYVTSFSGSDSINSNFWESFSWIKELALQVVDPNAPSGHGLRFIYIAVTFILLLGIISFVLGLARRG